jgi:hypothetical protein
MRRYFDTDFGKHQVLWDFPAALFGIAQVRRISPTFTNPTGPTPFGYLAHTRIPTASRTNTAGSSEVSGAPGENARRLPELGNVLR